MKKLISLIVLSLCTMRITLCMEQRDKSLKEELVAEIKSDNPSIQRITHLINCQALTQGGTDESPLLVAAEKGYGEICKLLIESGADATAKDPMGRSLFDHLFWYYNDRSSEIAETFKTLISHGYIVQPDDLIRISIMTYDNFGATSRMLQAFKQQIVQNELSSPQTEVFQRAFAESICGDAHHDDETDPGIPDLLLDSGAEVLDYAHDPLSFEFCRNVYDIISCNSVALSFHTEYMKKILARSLGRPELRRTQEQARATIIATLILMKRKGVSKDVAWYILHLAQEDLINYFAPLIMNRQCKKIPRIFIPLLHSIFYEATINELKRIIQVILNSEEQEFIDDEAREKFASEVIEDTIGEILSENILRRLTAPSLPI